MRFSIFTPILWLAASAAAYYTMLSYAPLHPEVHLKVINAHNKIFAIGAENPTTFCGLEDPEQCPPANSTLVDAEMTRLAVSKPSLPSRLPTTHHPIQSAVPGGQFIYVAPDGIISYPSAHSAHRPPGSQVGGFFSFRLFSECVVAITVLSWQSAHGATGLWACPSPAGHSISDLAVLKASSTEFTGQGCLELEGVHIREAGDEFGAWAYT